MSERTPPANLAAERAVLGACLLERNAIVALAPVLTADDFYLQKHGLIYAAMLACYHERTPPDLATVAERLRRHAQLDAIGGVVFLSDMVAEVPTAVHALYYAEIVSRTATLRRLIEAGGKVTALGYNEQDALEVTLDQAEQTIFAITQRQRGSDFVPLEVVVSDYFERATQHPEQPTPTGFYDLDRRFNGGWRPGNLVLLAARPGMGKTGLALSIAANLARAGRGVGIVSLEMSRDELLERLVAMHLGQDLRHVQQQVRAGDRATLDALGVMSSAPIYIDDTPAPTLMELRSKARRLHSQHQLALVIVDYLQLLVDDSRPVSRVEEVGRISRGLKTLARELQVPVLALSQLNRAIERRLTPVPMLSDLRDSGSLEQDAHIVLFIHREELYDPNTAKRGIAELIVAKNRNGPIGSELLRFVAPTTGFQNLQR
ncbi:MAG: replicative DNA helicase [Chloroflexaceae bacterium]|nr:replicative DNA helicase [Chloroflexaceae bacterium]NJO07339.1 replicative DNA helicase [Chloroflexaceae bacterium]